MKGIMRQCLTCKELMPITGHNQKRCKVCARKHNLSVMRNWRLANIVKGVGSGSTTGKGELNLMYKHGNCVFDRWAREKLQELNNNCERCGKIIDVSKRGFWAGHHKDHNSSNNIKENLEILCKRCHQVEHKCWTAFKGVTTISKESTHENVEAHSLE
jgi:hypothetical protein